MARVTHPDRLKAYVLWGALGPFGVHCFYCQRWLWGALELALALAAIVLLHKSHLDLSALIGAANGEDMAVLGKPESWVAIGRPDLFAWAKYAIGANTALWALDGWLVHVWTRTNQ